MLHGLNLFVTRGKVLRRSMSFIHIYKILSGLDWRYILLYDVYTLIFKFDNLNQTIRILLRKLNKILVLEGGGRASGRNMLQRVNACYVDCSVFSV